MFNFCLWQKASHPLNNGPFTLSINDWFGASVSTLASYLTSWGYNRHLEWLAWFIKKFNQNDIASDVTASTLTLSVNGPKTHGLNSNGSTGHLPFPVCYCLYILYELAQSIISSSDSDESEQKRGYRTDWCFHFANSSCVHEKPLAVAKENVPLCNEIRHQRKDLL